MYASGKSRTERLSERRAYLQSLLQVFDSLYPTDEDCVEELFRIARCGTVQCRHCNGTRLRRERGSRFFKCLDCNRQTYFTAGTFFARIRAVKATVFSICLMEVGVEFNSSEIHWLTSVSYDTAWKLSKRLSIVIRSRMNKYDLVSSSEFVKLFARRSSQTPAGEHPRSEEREFVREGDDPDWKEGRKLKTMKQASPRNWSRVNSDKQAR